MNSEWINAGIGGILIGISVSLMLLWNGRVTGISGIINGVLTPEKDDTQWRVLFILGLLLGGLLIGNLKPDAFINTIQSSDWTLVIAGLFVGFGTIMGSGCTSGHGVCGISRLSPRSILATLAFMIAGILAVVIFRNLGVIS